MSKFLTLVFLVTAGMLLVIPEADAGPNCEKKPDHPSCSGGGDGGDGGGSDGGTDTCDSTSSKRGS